MEQQYDVVVVGAGPGGYVAAIRAAQLGLKTAIVEKRFWGGVCLNVGCIPSKALLRSASLVRLLREEAEAFGIRIEGRVGFDYAAAVRRSRGVAEARARGVRHLLRKNGVEALEGWARFAGPRRLEVEGTAGETAGIGFRHAIVAAGATPRQVAPPSPRVVGYEEQILSEQLPRRLVIVGAGAIGVEFAHIARSYGSEVTLVEALDRVLPLEDEDVSAELRRRYARRGVRILTGARVEAVEDAADDVRVSVRLADGAAETLVADRVLQAVGFTPRTTGYGLETTGVRLSPRGGIEVDARLRTSVAGILAIGDVTGRVMLAHAAEAMALVAAEEIAGVPGPGFDFDGVPRAIYAEPQVASVGLTEREARERGLDVRVARFPFQANGKAQALGDASGFVKLLADARYGELVGAHLVGPDVTELLPELTLARLAELTVEEIARNVHPHPTLSEAVLHAAHGLAGGFINL